MTDAAAQDEITAEIDAATPLDGAAVTIEGDSLLHVVAASGDGKEFLRCAKMIVRDKGGAAAMRQVLEARNSRGDTPLHCAAAAGNAEMISCLVDLVATTVDEDEDAAAVKKAFLEVQNKYGETVLHHVMKRAGMMHNRHASKNTPASMLYNKHVIHSYDMIQNLMSMDPDLACVLTHEGISPLFLAISLGEMEIARYLIVKAKEGDDHLSYYSGSDGQNILHAAVSCGHAHAPPMVLNWLKEPKTAGIMQEEGQAEAANGRAAVAADLLIKELTSQRDKKNESTPLHLAASLWGFPSTERVPFWSWKWLASSAIMKLLDANPSMAYQADKEGLYPIHVSAAVGANLDIKRLLGRLPDCASLRDGKGRTFLHVAVEKERFHVVKYVCQTPALSWILNAQDSNGDTAMHRAVHSGNLSVFGRLFWNPQVRLDVPNKEGMRPIDVSWSVMPLHAYYSWHPRINIRNLLLKASAPYGESRGDLFMEKNAAIIPEFKGGEHKISENLTSAAQVMGILSVLVTTVTFASAFTLPGGYRSVGDSGGAAGTPVLAGSYAFEAFLLADALAFICSLVATSLLLYAGVPALELHSRFLFVNLAYGLMMNSGRSLLVAFGVGLYVALDPVARTVPITVIVCMSLVAVIFIKGSEGIDSTLSFYPTFPTRQKLSAQDRVLGYFLCVLERFWSYILIFGIPAIRKWARAK
ncbi:unnamed protein product [Urochloa decumbens]|uniref:PGG domain-containing protein n=1 Tax=Urochloa decumbens TaxID=240449 RepID=A0ABC9ATA4_9POAL